MKKVLMFSHEFPPFIGGVGSVGYQITKWLNEKGYKVDVLTRYQKNIDYIQGVNFKVVKVAPKFWFLSYKKYLKKLDLGSYDAIILNECAPTIVAGKYFSDELLNKSIVYLHGLEVENIYTKNKRNFLRNLFGFRCDHLRAVNKAKNVIAVGKHMKSKYVESVNNELVRGVDVIYAGLDINQFDIVNTSERIKPFTLISSSRIVKEKGYFDKLEIFRFLTKKLDLNWIICGDGDDLNELKSRVNLYGLSEKVDFKGYCSRNELKKHYSNADIFWLLSNYDEALPLSYIEAQLSGLPTVGRNKGGTKETILDGINGFLVDGERDCINKLSSYIMSDKKFDRKNVRKSAMYFNIDTTLLKLEALL
ncbi:glycosyltransferase family 4 protein [Vibrio aphrogenes]|uniref:glycosyltransferase family 4 protein n=1 Tax=Vibrio aphrogenes TaxID=1891186 RepID=UPI000B34BF1A|nr:glycosyltransferase family 4 protein [Vibrio aphrogenes]